MSRAATGTTPARYFVVMTRVVPVKATSPAAACRKAEKVTPRHGALLGTSFAVGSPEEVEAVLARVAADQPGARLIIEVRA